jgi:hypothetical protein
MARKQIGDRWRRLTSDAVLVVIYAGVVWALFGGFADDRISRSATAKIALTSTAMMVLVVAGIWLDRREARREGALPED